MALPTTAGSTRSASACGTRSWICSRSFGTSSRVALGSTESARPRARAHSSTSPGSTTGSWTACSRYRRPRSSTSTSLGLRSPSSTSAGCSRISPSTRSSCRGTSPTSCAAIFCARASVETLSCRCPSHYRHGAREPRLTTRWCRSSFARRTNALRARGDRVTRESDLPQLRGHRPGWRVARWNRGISRDAHIHAARRRLRTRRRHWGRLQSSVRPLRGRHRGKSGLRQPPRARRPRIGRRRISSTSSRGSRLRCRPADRRGRVAARTLHSFAVRSRGGAAMRAVPPFSTAFFSRNRCGAELRCDPSLMTCADYDLWLRISHLELVSTPIVLGRTRISGSSMTCNPEHYEGFCRDKLAALDRHLENRGSAETERAAAVAGIHCWAAESLFALEGPSARCRSMLQRALAAVPDYPRALRMTARLRDSPDDAE